LTIIVNIGVEHFGQKTDLGCLVGVVFGKFEYKFEGTTFPGGVIWSEDDGLPEHDVCVHGCSGDSAGRIILEPRHEMWMRDEQCGSKNSVQEKTTTIPGNSD
jgi:hypothetical protein